MHRGPEQTVPFERIVALAAAGRSCEPLPAVGASILKGVRLQVLCTALLAWLAIPSAAFAAPKVRIGPQELVGIAEAGGISSFRGIAYARPPIGALRWKPPRRPAASRGRIDATRFAPVCAQDNGNTQWYRNAAEAMGADPAAIIGPARVSEDCLYLNIWTPHPRALPARRQLPVMVWLHGGSNANGYSHEPNYIGMPLAMQGAVVVSINYRVGLLGFFTHPALGDDATGRQGLFDQLAALRWIKANVARFGGDPARITVFGESAGGTDIAVLAAMPQAKGLIARAIIQSGYLPRPSVSTRSAAQALATELFGAKASAESLRALPWQDIIRLQGEKLPRHFYAPVASWPQRSNVPLLIGSNTDESLMYQPKDQAGKERDLAAALKGLSPPDLAAVSAMLEGFAADVPGRLNAVSASAFFHCPAARFASATAAAGRRTFVYRFERVRPGGHGLGAYHGAEIPYVFGQDDAWLPSAPADRALSRIMQRYWLNFARSGNPNGPGLPLWPDWRSPAPRLLALDEAIAAKPAPLAGLCTLLPSGL